MDTQLFCRGVLCPPLGKEIYTTPSEVLLDNTAKNLVIHHHYTMGLIDRVRDSERIVYKLSQLIDELRAEVQKLKDKTSPIAVATTHAQASEATE
ncbi:hypothetical protein GW17_00032212 [Ensete ventricosum]|nr:hypothetical protein GW17_00032212 [Ensete ventricosum]RZR85839.1 hypothetical protein BHM03_00012904 [Ensete ventricosum]